MNDNASPQATTQAISGAGKGGVIPPVETRFKPGQSGNPGGKPKNDKLALHIREATNEGKDLCDYVLGRFQEPIPPEAAATTVVALREEKMEAATWLADRGFAKPRPIDEPSNPGQLGTTLVQVLVSLGPEVVREVNRRLIEASGGVVDVTPEQKPE